MGHGASRWKRASGRPPFLNFGRNYAGARDGYVYTYSQDGASAYESDNGIVLARVPRERITDRCGLGVLRAAGRARPAGVDSGPGRRGAVFEKPGGCQRVDVVYNPGWAISDGVVVQPRRAVGAFSTRPSRGVRGRPCLHSEAQAGDIAGTHGYRLPAKWIGRDGLTMTLVFSGDAEGHE